MRDGMPQAVYPLTCLSDCMQLWLLYIFLARAATSTKSFDAYSLIKMTKSPGIGIVPLIINIYFVLKVHINIILGAKKLQHNTRHVHNK